MPSWDPQSLSFIFHHDRKPEKAMEQPIYKYSSDAAAMDIYVRYQMTKRPPTAVAVM